jgi:hypothetical protein
MLTLSNCLIKYRSESYPSEEHEALYLIHFAGKTKKWYTIPPATCHNDVQIPFYVFLECQANAPA